MFSWPKNPINLLVNINSGICIIYNGNVKRFLSAKYNYGEYILIVTMNALLVEE